MNFLSVTTDTPSWVDGIRDSFTSVSRVRILDILPLILTNCSFHCHDHDLRQDTSRTPSDSEILGLKGKPRFSCAEVLSSYLGARGKRVHVHVPHGTSILVSIIFSPYCL
jgi:hypothetical protein